MADFKLFQFCMPDEDAEPTQDQLAIWMEAANGQISRAIDEGFYREIATVTADDIEQVFELTNSIDSDWTQGPHVVMAVPRARSSMMGDVVQEIDGDRLLLCARFGWEELEQGQGAAFRAKLGHGQDDPRP